MILQINSSRRLRFERGMGESRLAYTRGAFSMLYLVKHSMRSQRLQSFVHKPVDFNCDFGRSWLFLLKVFVIHESNPQLILYC
jgi:hypothetical protein